jgi:arylsulfatase A-like enzyme
MMRRGGLRLNTACAGIALLLAGLAASPATADTTVAAPNDGAISQEAAQMSAKPNILVWMLDDVGFAQLSAFGGLVATPNIDRIANRGVRYSNFHTTPICSSSRAAFLTGRNAHTVNMGGHNAFARELPGYNGRIPASAGTIAENLRQAGYSTFALGKWDHLPIAESSPSGPFNYWPQGQGFNKFYGFMSSETDNFFPHLWRNNAIVNPERDDYHLNDDLAAEAIAMLRSRDGAARPAPFFLYWATGTAHAPHHAPQEWIDRYAGKFDMGWDEARKAILRDQKAKGLIPPSAKVGPRPQDMAAWDSLSAEQQKLYARQMEVFAAALSHADEQFGHILNELERRGELENTIFVVVSDNGASAEGGIGGTHNELFFATNRMPSVEENLERYEEWGGPETYPHYAFGWAVAGNTPFSYYKQTTYEGGIRVPLIISAPMNAHAGRVEDDFVHVADIAPTLLSLAGVKPAEKVNGVAQMPFDGRNVDYTLLDPEADGPARSQYFEMFGHKAFVSGDWKLVSPSRLNVWDISAPAEMDNPWQLYDIASDLAETTDLAAGNPDRVAEMERAFEEQAEQYNVNPIGDQRTAAMGMMKRMGEDFRARKGRWTYTGPISRIVKQLAPPIERGNVMVTADITLATSTETGPIFALGGRHGGFALYLKDGHPKFILRDLAGKTVELAAARGLSSGPQRLVLDIGPSSAVGHTISIASDGQILAEELITMPIPAMVPETFDVGRDDATPVSEDYEANVDFPGDLRSLTFQFRQPDE